MTSITIRRVQILVGAIDLSGTFLCSKDKGLRPAIIFIHGWRGNQTRYTELAKNFAANGMACLTFDMRGSDSSEGNVENATRSEHLEDVLAAYDFLANHPRVDRSRIGVFGASYGGSMAMLLSAKRPIAWIALRAPALYRDGGFNKPTIKAIGTLGTYRWTAVIPSRNMALKALSSFTGDVLVVAGENDKDVPLQTITNVIRACRSARSVEQHTIAGADHRLSEDVWRNEATAAFTRWILER